MGSRLENRKPSEVMTGFGGAGTYSDGKLHYTPKLSHERTFHLIDPDDYQKILDEVEKIFTDFGVDSEYFPKNEAEVEALVAEAEKNDVELVLRLSLIFLRREAQRRVHYHLRNPQGTCCQHGNL